jgi:hypothetical protein
MCCPVLEVGDVMKGKNVLGEFAALSGGGALYLSPFHAAFSD